jgi:hypothetical protein
MGEANLVLDGFMPKLCSVLGDSCGCYTICHVIIWYIEKKILVAISAVCWFVWKVRNDCIFRNGTVPTIRNIVVLGLFVMSLFVLGLYTICHVIICVRTFCI